MFNVYTRQRWGNFLACCWSFIARPSMERRAMRALRRGDVGAMGGLVAHEGLAVQDPLTPSPGDYSSDMRVAEKTGTLLHQAAARGDLDMVVWLVEQGAQVECFTSWGRSPIMSAAAAGHAHVVAWLASRGADPHRPRPAENTFIDEFPGPSSVRLLSYHDIEYTGQEHLPYLAAKLDAALPLANDTAPRSRF